MEVMTYRRLSENLANEMDKICDNHAPVIVTREGAGAVVMVSLADYRAMQETTYLLHSPTNALRLFESIAELDGLGKG